MADKRLKVELEKLAQFYFERGIAVSVDEARGNAENATCMGALLYIVKEKVEDFLAAQFASFLMDEAAGSPEPLNNKANAKMADDGLKDELDVIFQRDSMDEDHNGTDENSNVAGKRLEDIITVLSKMYVERGLVSSLAEARNNVENAACVGICLYMLREKTEDLLISQFEPLLQTDRSQLPSLLASMCSDESKRNDILEQNFQSCTEWQELATVFSPSFKPGYNVDAEVVLEVLINTNCFHTSVHFLAKSLLKWRYKWAHMTTHMYSDKEFNEFYRDYAMLLREIQVARSKYQPLRILVMGAADQVAYLLLHSLVKGDVFGPNQPMNVVLLDIEANMNAMTDIAMEMMESVPPLLKGITPTTDVEAAFKDIDFAILLGAAQRKDGMERKDLLRANAKIFRQLGEALDKYAKKHVKVLVVGDQANTNAFICKKYAPDIAPENITCLTRLDQNRARSEIAARVGVLEKDVHNIIIWGNHSATQFPDVEHATVEVGGKTVKVSDVVKDDEWIKNDFIPTVQKRDAGAAAGKLSSAMSAAKAICDHLHDWWYGTEKGHWVSMGVPSDGSYGIKEGLMYSFPIGICPTDHYFIIQDLSIDEFARDMMDATEKELKEERDVALDACSD